VIAAVLAGGAVFAGLVRKLGRRCPPWLFLYGSAGAGLLMYFLFRKLLGPW